MLMKILIVGEHNDVPDGEYFVSCNELHPKWIIEFLFCGRIITIDQALMNHWRADLNRYILLSLVDVLLKSTTAHVLPHFQFEDIKLQNHYMAQLRKKKKKGA